MSRARRTEAFQGRAVLIMILVGVVAFAALTVLSVYAPQLSSGDDGGGHPLSRSAVGFSGAAKFFKARGETVLVSRGPVRGEVGLLILTPAAGQDMKAVNKVAFEGMRLIVLPKWAPRPHPFRKGWVARAGVTPVSAISGDLLKGLGRDLRLQRRAGHGQPRLSRAYGGGAQMTAGRIEAFQTLAGPGLEPIVTDEHGAIVVGRLPKSDTFILSDPDLLNTQGLKSLDTARFADVMIHDVKQEGPLVFDATLHGYKRTRNLLTLALEPPFLGGTLCAVAAALLAGLGAAIRFGPVRRPAAPFALGKEALVDNTAGLIRMARREHRMAEGYARLCRTLAARSVGAPRRLEEAELDAFLDRLGQTRGAADTYTDLIRTAREARDVGALMSVARKLYDWRLEMTREHR